jgi:type IV pilus assembly protein PilE
MENTPTPLSPLPAKASGFTMVELMIVVAIVAILAAIAYPSYRDHVRRANRTEGQALLLDAAAKQERFFSENNSYTATVGAGGLGLSTTSENGYYTLAIAAATAGCPIATCFVAQVTPAGGQSDDTTCAVMSISQTGAKAATDTGGTDTRTVCWR